MESMTGFGDASALLDGFRITAAARSVNHRGLNVVLRFPREAGCLEGEVHERVKALFPRGRIDIALTLEGDSEGRGSLEVDTERAEACIRALEALSRSFGLEPGATAFGMLSLPGVLRLPDPSRSGGFRQAVLDAVQGALDTLKASRIREGLALAAMFRDTLDALETQVQPVAEGHGERVKTLHERSRKRVAELLAGAELDEARLAQEIALLADRLDVSEECQRLLYHVREVRSLLKEPVCGMKLGFMIQEMQRELNTLGAKVADPDAVHRVIAMKELTGTMKEQAANVQ